MRIAHGACTMLVTWAAAGAAGCRSLDIDKIDPKAVEAHARPERVESLAEEDWMVKRLKDFPRHAVEQRESVWCWAACAQMIHSFNGQPIDQKAIAERIHGMEDDGQARVRAASVYEIMCALNPEMPRSQVEDLLSEFTTLYDSDVKPADVTAEANPERYLIARLRQSLTGPSSAIRDLIEGHPSVIGLSDGEDSDQGHAYVLFAARVREVNAGGFKGFGKRLAKLFQDDLPELAALNTTEYEIDWMELIDPYTGEAVRVSSSELSSRADFCISKRESAAILKSRMEAVNLTPKG